MPWRQPGSVSQLLMGTRIWNADASSSRDPAPGAPGSCPGGTGAASAGGDGASGPVPMSSTLIAAPVGGSAGSIRSTGPCGEASASSTGSRTTSRVTVVPAQEGSCARPSPSNTHPSGP